LFSLSEVCLEVFQLSEVKLNDPREKKVKFKMIEDD